jgi:pyruvate/2-oxoglutarate dehydrogenase complex dihydrolipoamide acyltransferase (E2) component
MLCEIEMEGEGAEEASSKPVDPLPPTAPGNATAKEPSDNKVTQPTPVEQPSEGRRGEKREVWATPATRRIAREEKIDLADVTGTGPQGRVTKGDVLAFVAAGSSSTSSSTSNPTSSPSSPTPSLASTSATTTLPLSAVRKAMFRAMTSSLQIPHFSYSETLDVTSLERLRLSLNKHIPLRHRKTLKPAEEATIGRLGEWGVAEQSERVPEEKRFDRLTLLPLFIKALSLAMHEHPIFSCSLTAPSSTSTDHSLTRRSSHDISIALSSPSGGLYTPLLPSVDSSSPYALASQIAHLQHCATASSPPKFPTEFKGTGTITLSNVGVVGGTTTHPIVPPTGQLAIGALGRMRVEPRYVGTENARAKEVARGTEELPFGEELKMEPRLLLVSCLAGVLQMELLANLFSSPRYRTSPSRRTIEWSRESSSPSSLRAGNASSRSRRGLLDWAGSFSQSALYRKDQYRGPVEAELLGEGERRPTNIELEQTEELKACRVRRKEVTQRALTRQRTSQQAPLFVLNSRHQPFASLPSTLSCLFVDRLSKLRLLYRSLFCALKSLLEPPIRLYVAYSVDRFRVPI